MALWFGVTYVDLDSQDILDSQIHGPYDDMDALEEAVLEKSEEASSMGDNVITVPLQFELCTDDVPEIVTDVLEV